MTSDVSEYIARSTMWPEEMATLRPILLAHGLTEEIKWGKPCYSSDGAKIAIMQEMKGFLSLMFFKGVFLDDPEGVLQSQGKNTRSALRICFTSIEEVERLAPALPSYIAQAIEVEEAGLEVGPAPEPEWADVLYERLASDGDFAAAFEGLTPGRRREYNLHISGAKQQKTRQSRLDKVVPKIMAGKGWRDR